VLTTSGPKRDEMVDGWRKLHTKELHNLFSSPNRMIMSRKMIWAGHVAHTGEKRNAYRILVRKAGRKETNRKTGKGLEGSGQGLIELPAFKWRV
jgi:hypothetical protein